MKTIIFIVICFLLVACKTSSVKNETPLITADSLTANIENFINRQVAVEGKIIHVCPVDGKKMKLLCDGGVILKIVSDHPGEQFEHSWNGKRIKVTGNVLETRLPRSYVDSIHNSRTLLCHIDHTPCSDTAWVSRKAQNGQTDQIVEETNDQLKKVMEKTGKEYISVVTLVANKVEEIEIVTEGEVKTATPIACNNCPNCGICLLCGLCVRKV